MKNTLLILAVVLYSVAIKMYFLFFHLDFSRSGNALFYLWQRSSDLFLWVAITVLFCQLTNSFAYRYVKVLLYTICAIDFILVQWGYIVDTGYPENAGYIYYGINLTIIWTVVNIKLWRLYNDMFLEASNGFWDWVLLKSGIKKAS